MEKMTLREFYTRYKDALSKLSVADSKINTDNIYQPYNEKTRAIVDNFLGTELIQKDSHIENVENIEKFCDLVNEGKHGLILMEHYSNADLPEFMYLLQTSESEKLRDLSKKIVAIAGMKLNEASPAIKAITESYTRVVIYPTRSISKMEKENLSPEEIEEETKRARAINFAAMRAMSDCKKRGEVILVFPAGTRYRPGHPETKRGLREMDSYLRLFDVVLLVSIHGTVLSYQNEDMMEDLIEPNNVYFGASDVIECKPFRNDFIATLPEDCEDPKQEMIDHVMHILDVQHEEIDKKLGR